MNLEDIKVGEGSTSEYKKFVLWSRKRGFYKKLKADPDKPVVTTDDKLQARFWDDLLSAKKFLEDNSLDNKGFEAIQIEISLDYD